MSPPHQENGVQANVTRRASPELALDNPKQKLPLGKDAGHELFQFVTQRVAGFGFFQRFALARQHGYLPLINIRVCSLIS